MTITRPFFYLASMALLGGVTTSMATPVSAQSSTSASATAAPVVASSFKSAQPRVLHTHTPVVVGHRQLPNAHPAAKAAKPATESHYMPHAGNPIDAYRNAVTPSPVIAGR
jgi:hypothetical protein